MLRFSVEGLALFLLPFLIYGLLLVFASRVPVLQRNWKRGPILVLAICGCGLVILGLLGLGVFGDRSRGSYVPAHIEQGRLVPGHME